jgi:predicted Zn-dependent peptidase
VLGHPASLKKQTGETLRAFKEQTYIAPRVVIALGGSFSGGDLEHIARRFSVMEHAENVLPEPAAFTASFTAKKKATEQNHLVLGFPGLKITSGDRFAMQLLSSILGGNASSRLFQTVREKHSLCYSIYSFTSGFEEAGIFGIATATGRDTEKKAAELIMGELRRIREDGVTDDELKRANEQVKSSILMSLESTATRMNRLGYGELFLGTPLTADELIECYDSVTRSDILTLTQRTLCFENMSFSAVGRTGDEEYYREILK